MWLLAVAACNSANGSALVLSETSSGGHRWHGHGRTEMADAWGVPNEKDRRGLSERDTDARSNASVRSSGGGWRLGRRQDCAGACRDTKFGRRGACQKYDRSLEMNHTHAGINKSGKYYYIIIFRFGNTCSVYLFFSLKEWEM